MVVKKKENTATAGGGSIGVKSSQKSIGIPVKSSDKEPEKIIKPQTEIVEPENNTGITAEPTSIIVPEQKEQPVEAKPVIVKPVVIIPHVIETIKKNSELIEDDLKETKVLEDLNKVTINTEIKSDKLDLSKLKELTEKAIALFVGMPVLYYPNGIDYIEGNNNQQEFCPAIITSILSNADEHANLIVFPDCSMPIVRTSVYQNKQKDSPYFVINKKVLGF